MRGRCCAAARGGLSRAGGGRRTRTHAQPNSCSSRWRGDAPPPNEALQLTRPRSVPVRPHRSNPAALQLNLGVRRYAAASCRVKDIPSNSAATRSKAAVHDLTTLRRADLGASESAARSAIRAQANHSRGVKAVAATFAAVALAVLAWYACDAAGLSRGSVWGRRSRSRQRSPWDSFRIWHETQGASCSITSSRVRTVATKCSRLRTSAVN